MVFQIVLRTFQRYPLWSGVDKEEGVYWVKIPCYKRNSVNACVQALSTNQKAGKPTNITHYYVQIQSNPPTVSQNPPSDIPGYTYSLLSWLIYLKASLLLIKLLFLQILRLVRPFFHRHSQPSSYLPMYYVLLIILTFRLTELFELRAILQPLTWLLVLTFFSKNMTSQTILSLEVLESRFPTPFHGPPFFRP